MESTLVENAIRSLAMRRRNVLLPDTMTGLVAGLLCQPNRNLPNECRRAIRLPRRPVYQSGHLDKDIDALTPWDYAAKSEDVSFPVTP